MDASGSNDVLIGRRFGRDGRLEVQQKLGQGGVGAVYAAWDHAASRRVAIKFLRSDTSVDGEMVQRFKREGKRFAALRHPGIVRVHGLGREQGLLYVVTEFVEGATLTQLLDDQGAFEVDEALRICRDVADALHAAHREKVVHRDLKPDNVMLTDEGRQVRVLDFGIAKALDTQSVFTQQGVYLGTPGYSAPEQVKGLEIDHRADIFSLGTILYELLTGKIAFRGRHTVQVLRATIDKDPIPVTRFNAEVVAPVSKLIQRMIQKNPRRRPQDMVEVVQQIDGVRAALASGWAEGERRGIVGLLKSVFEPRT